MIRGISSNIELIYISDIGANNGLNLKVKYIFPNNIRDVEEVTRQLELVLAICEQVSALKLSSKARSEAEKERDIYHRERLRETQQQREEERMRKKQEEKKKEQENVLKMSKEKQRKYEEKEHKLSLKKSRAKFKVVKG